MIGPIVPEPWFTLTLAGHDIPSSRSLNRRVFPILRESVDVNTFPSLGLAKCKQIRTDQEGLHNGPNY